MVWFSLLFKRGPSLLIGFPQTRDIFRWICSARWLGLFCIFVLAFPVCAGPLTIRCTNARVWLQDSRRRRPPYPRVRRVRHPAPPPPHCPRPCPCPCPGRSSARQVNRKPRPVPPSPTYSPPFPLPSASLTVGSAGPTATATAPRLLGPHCPTLSPTGPCRGCPRAGPSSPAVVRSHAWHCFVVGLIPKRPL